MVRAGWQFGEAAGVVCNGCEVVEARDESAKLGCMFVGPGYGVVEDVYATADVDVQGLPFERL